jgi:UPF0716 family protein affecting phage T7 exclusion
MEPGFVRTLFGFLLCIPEHSRERSEQSPDNINSNTGANPV